MKSERWGRGHTGSCDLCIQINQDESRGVSTRKIVLRKRRGRRRSRVWEWPLIPAHENQMFLPEMPCKANTRRFLDYSLWIPWRRSSSWNVSGILGEVREGSRQNLCVGVGVTHAPKQKSIEKNPLLWLAAGLLLPLVVGLCHWHERQISEWIWYNNLKFPYG